MNTQRLAGKVTVIVGGTSDIGLATARAFRQAGATVVLTGVDQARMEEARGEFGSAAVLAMDVRDLGDIRRAVAAVKGSFGHVDVLFANSGRAHPGFQCCRQRRRRFARSRGRSRPS